MAQKTKCLTPGALFHTSIKPGKIKVKVEWECLRSSPLTKKEAKLAEKLIHNQLELVLGYFLWAE